MKFVAFFPKIAKNELKSYGLHLLNKCQNHFKTVFIQIIIIMKWSNLTKVTQGIGNSRGVEFAMSKINPKYNLNLNYTYSETDRQFDEINNAEPFPYRFDLRHVFSFSGNIKLNKRWSTNFNWVYSSGINQTVPVSKYNVKSIFTGVDPLSIPILSQRNAQQLPANHRLDVGLNYLLKGKSCLLYTSPSPRDS